MTQLAFSLIFAIHLMLVSIIELQGYYAFELIFFAWGEVDFLHGFEGYPTFLRVC
jgi:hypothetical protein